MEVGEVYLVLDSLSLSLSLALALARSRSPNMEVEGTPAVCGGGFLVFPGSYYCHFHDCFGERERESFFLVIN